VLEERFARIEERFAELEKRFAELEERQLRLEERFVELEKRFAELEKRFAELEERFARLEERQQKLEERFTVLEERQLRLEKSMEETRRVVIVIAHRYGVLTEEAFRSSMKYVVEEVLGVSKVEKLTLYDDEGIVYGHPSQIDIDVAIHNNIHILVEVKSRVTPGDVYILYKKGQLYMEKKGVKPKLVIIGGFIDSKAYETAERLGVEVKPIFRY
jgi:hypothetical protein